MFNNLVRFAKGCYSINICDNKVYIENYDKLIDINDTEILVMINNKLVKIIGKSLIIRRLEKSELLIEGFIKGIDLGAR